jgi:hypothetical protein
VGDNAKALIGLALTAVLAVVAYIVFGDNGLMAACAVAVVGLIAVFALQKLGGGGGDLDDDDDERYLDTSLADEAPAVPSGGAAGGGLPTWSPEPLATWSPPEDASEPEEITFTSFEEATDDDLDTSTFEELAGFDDLDAVAEADTYEVAEDAGTDVEYEEAVEAEVEAEPVRTSLFSAPAPIREDVSSADDILEASHATELHIEAPDTSDNSELAKLLAKVQSRLAAYE